MNPATKIYRAFGGYAGKKQEKPTTQREAAQQGKTPLSTTVFFSMIYCHLLFSLKNYFFPLSFYLCSSDTGISPSLEHCHYAFPSVWASISKAVLPQGIGGTHELFHPLDKTSSSLGCMCSALVSAPRPWRTVPGPPPSLPPSCCPGN